MDASSLLPTLAPEERERLRAEEIFRHEVRLTLAATQTVWQRVWTTLNSAFILWLLGTCAVGVITQWYGKTSATRATLSQSRKDKDRIGTEILVRFSNMATALDIARDPSRLQHARDAFNGRANESVYPEFRDTPLLALLLQFETMSKVPPYGPNSARFRKLYAELELSSRKGVVENDPDTQANTALSLKATAERAFNCFYAVLEDDRRLDAARR